MVCDGCTLPWPSSHLLHGGHPWTCGGLPDWRSHAKHLHGPEPTVSNGVYPPAFLSTQDAVGPKGCLIYNRRLEQGKAGLILATGAGGMQGL